MAKEVHNFAVYRYGNGATRCKADIVTVLFMAMHVKLQATGWVLFRSSDSAWFLVCVCVYSRVYNSFLTSRMNTFKSVNSRYFISEGRASRNSVSGLFLTVIALTSVQAHTAIWALLLNLSSSCFSFFALVYCPCGFQVQTFFPMAEESFLRLCPIYLHFCRLVCVSTQVLLWHKVRATDLKNVISL